MDKVIKALGIAVLTLQLVNFVYIIVFVGNIFDNSAQLNGMKVFYIGNSEIDNFLVAETMALFTSVLLTTLMIELEINFVSTLKKIIKIDEIAER